ncbi:keratin, type II cytoskeletal 5-like [Platysternon megacephalum]|uniref:Keratin, type II cytoskeletal 5-like n=1 Tax=Platysternon megacephalum TaxID=55544 RepID=A0A4D9E2Y2_9SAUR|nr:keratin, type II cytoskeletal 5-like [Platysternon megacephalum]
MEGSSTSNNKPENAETVRGTMAGKVDEEKSLNRPFLSITHNGIISTTQQHQVTITCNLEMHKFPFDIQTCSISLFSFNHPATDLILQSNQTTDEVNKNSKLYHLTNGEWKFTNINIIPDRLEDEEEVFTGIIYEYCTLLMGDLDHPEITHTKIITALAKGETYLIESYNPLRRVDEEKFLNRPFLSITHKGIISTTQQHHVTIACNLEMHKFPFDTQTCSITLLSLPYSDIIFWSNQTTDEVTETSQLIHLTSGEWKFTNINITKHEVFSGITYEETGNDVGSILSYSHFVFGNRVDEEKSLSRPFLSITHNGIVSTTQQHQTTITCSLEMRQFPFDTQACNMSISSVMYSATDIILLPNQTTEEANKQSQLYHLTNGEWKFTNINIIQYTESMEEEEFAVITYEVLHHQCISHTIYFIHWFIINAPFRTSGLSYKN